MVYFLDLSPKNITEAQKLKLILPNKTKVVIIDHNPLKYNPIEFGFKYIYKLGISASVLSWRYWFSNEVEPYVVKLIHDREVWQNKLQPQTNYLYRVRKLMTNEDMLEAVRQTRCKVFKDIEAWLAVGEVFEDRKSLKKAINSNTL